MAQIMIQDYPATCRVWDYYSNVGSHYMVDILEWCDTHCGDDKKIYSLFIGMDQLKDFKKWKDWEKILKHHTVYVVQRVGESLEDVPADLRRHKSVKILKDRVAVQPISSTQIRNAIQSGLPDELEKIKPYVDLEILKYIYDHGLYRMPFYDLSPS